MTNAERARKAMEFVLDHERVQGRAPIDVSKDRIHSGYDILSDCRQIEVKGVGESWNTYTWQGLYKSEVDCLKQDPTNFYLYIVKFVDKESDNIEHLYIIPGCALVSHFHIEIELYAIAPISQAKLSEYIVDTTT